jgi:UDP-N-acetylglucosamine 4,6-dehydratase
LNTTKAISACRVNMFENTTLLITGGTGSFGNAVLQRFLETSVQEIRVFSRDEKKQEDMRLALDSPKVKFYIGDVRNYDSIYDAMHGVDYVFHAAALKQVPSCEFYPLEAIRTNALGTENVMNAAIARGVRRMVVLSTDKAVYPINAMGMSKAMMEKLMIAKSRVRSGHSTILCGTRYGNVMGSRGSVIPLFISQIKTGQPVTITDPSMTRFLMSLPESVDLVLQAFSNGQSGDMFVQKAPACTIEVLAQALIGLFGTARSEVRIIGTRHGEKLYETLVSREEMAKASEDDRYFRIPSDNRDLNYAKYFVEGQAAVTSFEDYTSHNTVRLDVEAVCRLLLPLDFVQKQLRS